MLTSYYVITPTYKDVSQLLVDLPYWAGCGYELVQVRQKHLKKQSVFSVLPQAIELAQMLNMQIMLNSEHFSDKRSCGLHLTQNALHQYSTRPLARSQLLAASCHNLADIKQAEKIEVDFITLSPVLQTQSHPQAIPMGWQQLHSFCQQTSLPVYALGGMNKELLERAQSCGAVGIAAITGLANQ